MNDSHLLNAEEARKKIIEIFEKNVKGKKPTYKVGANLKHSGKEGHWLEKMMGIPANSKTAPDLYGYEMKKESKNKTSFGDWSADYYIFKSRGNKVSTLSRNEFLEMFGKPNAKKENRYSWSGEPCPKIGSYNFFGQRLIVDSSQNIKAVYSYDFDKRSNKVQIISDKYRNGVIILAVWNYESVKKKVEDKFNNNGWFKCCADANGNYNSIKFGKPISMQSWINFVKSGEIYFDSGMYQGNSRNYSQWRANNSLWEKLVAETYPKNILYKR